VKTIAVMLHKSVLSIGIQVCSIYYCILLFKKNVQLKDKLLTIGY